MAKTTSIDVEELFKAGAHFGHKTSSWNPKMSSYIHSKRGGIHIIDLILTAEELTEALEALETVMANGGQVLLVGTKRQARKTIKELGKDTGMPYVTYRWLGGMLTNWETIKTRIERLEELEEQLESGELEDFYTKKEILDFEAERDTLEEKFGSIRNMDGAPSMIFIVDVEQEIIAVKEARKLNIPIVGMVDTNADPDVVDYVIPANDDALKSIEAICNYVREAIQTGKARQEEVKRKKKEERAKKQEEKKKAAKEKKKKENKKKSAKAKKEDSSSQTSKEVSEDKEKKDDSKKSKKTKKSKPTKKKSKQSKKEEE